MHILFLSAWYPYPPDNGSKIRVHHLLRGLSARHEVDLVTFLPPDGTVPHGDLVAEGLCARAHLVRRAPFEADPWQKRRGLFSRTPSHLKAYRSIEMEQLAASLAAARNLDVVIASTGLVAPIAIRLPARARILEEHNYLGRMLGEQYERATDPLRRCRSWLTWR